MAASRVADPAAPAAAPAAACPVAAAQVAAAPAAALPAALPARVNPDSYMVDRHPIGCGGGQSFCLAEEAMPSIRRYSFSIYLRFYLPNAYQPNAYQLNA